MDGWKKYKKKDMNKEREKKLEAVIDRILSKTLAGKCDWGRDNVHQRKFILNFDYGTQLRLHDDEINGKVFLDIYNEDRVLIISIINKDEKSNVVELYNHVKSYHEKRTEKLLDELLADLNKLSSADKLTTPEEIRAKKNSRNYAADLTHKDGSPLPKLRFRPSLTWNPFKSRR